MDKAEEELPPRHRKPHAPWTGPLPTQAPVGKVVDSGVNISKMADLIAAPSCTGRSNDRYRTLPLASTRRGRWFGSFKADRLGRWSYVELAVSLRHLPA